MAITTQGFDFGRGLLGEARQATGLLSDAATVQKQQFVNEQLQEQAQRQAQVRGLLGGIGQPIPGQPQPVGQELLGPPQEQPAVQVPAPIPSQEELIAQARQIDPAFANQQMKALGLDDASKRAEASRFAAQLQSVPFENRTQMINERAQKLQSEGRDPKDTLELLNLPEEQQNRALTGVQLLDLSTKDRLTLQAKAAKTAPGLGEVKSSKILDDGTAITVLKNNETTVIDPAGNILTGDARTQAIRDAQEFGVDVQQRRSKGRELGKGAGKAALDGFERVGKIKENIADLQRGIDLIEKEGATTGFVQDFLPNMRASTRKFANLRRKLGLNVVGSVTFGALSKGELDLAMDVALPKGISPEATVKWIKDRVEAQQKLATNLEDAALYLADHSVAELIQRNRAMNKAAKKKEEVVSQQREALTPEQIKNMSTEELRRLAQ